MPHLSLTLQDGDWVKEAAMSASLRDTTEPSTWFRWLSLGVFAVAPLAGQIATGLRCQHDGRCVSCTRVPQQRWSLSAVNLHPPCRVSFSAEVAAAFTDAFFWRCGFACLPGLAVSSSTLTFLEQATAFKFSSQAGSAAGTGPATGASAGQNQVPRRDQSI